MIVVRVGPQDFDAGVELEALGALGGGGVASFVGHVRGEGGLVSLTLEHHPAMTERMLRDIAAAAAARWDLLGATVVHRVGRLAAGERIVFVGTAAPHRAAALEACACLMDGLKTDAPFWKKEAFADGAARWVAARGEDASARERWGS